MKRHPTSSRDWFQAHAEELASSGIVDIIRRRSQQLLFSSAMREELHRFGARPHECDPAQRAAENVRNHLLAAWALAESSRRHDSGVADLDLHLASASR